MLFQPELAQQITLGKKTQTRRPKKAWETLEIVDGVKRVLTPSGNLKHAVGSIRAIPYGRGKPTIWWNPETCQLMDWDNYVEGIKLYGKKNVLTRLPNEGFIPLKYEILDIEEDADVRNITHQDSVAEGFNRKYQFLYTWMMLYDDTFAYRLLDKVVSPHDDPLPDHCPDWLRDRPDYKYQDVWKYTFKLHVEQSHEL